MGTRAFGLSLPQLWAFLSVALPVVAALAAVNLTRDFGYQIRTGEIMLRTHSFVRTELFTFTAHGRAWLNQQWGAHILFALFHRAGSWTAFALARAVLVGLIFLFVYLACRSAGAGMRAAAWLTLGAFVVSVEDLTLRPQLLAAALFAFTLWVVAGRRRHPGRLWAVPAIAAVWANLHGSFFFAPVLLGLAFLEDRRDRWPRASVTLAMAATSGVATLLNPFGARVWSYSMGISTNPLITRFVAEWQPPSIREVDGILFFLSAIGVAALLASRRQRTPWISLLSLGIFFAVALQAARGILWWALAVPVILVPILRDGAGTWARPEQAEEPRSKLAATIALIALALAVSLLPWWRDGNPLASSQGLTADEPVALTAKLQQILGPGQRIFTAEAWSSWFELNLPSNPTFVDSRIEVFPPSVWRQYVEVSFGEEGWQRILDRWNVAVVAADRGEQAGLIPRIQRDPRWRQIYQDVKGYVFERAS